MLRSRSANMKRPAVKPSERLRQLILYAAQRRTGSASRLDAEMAASDRTAGRVDVRALLRR